MVGVPNFHIPEQDYLTIVGNGTWKINEIPLATAMKIRDHFGLDTSFAVFGSGLAPLPAEVEAEMPIAGIDWIRIEDNPRSGEKPLNVYHFIIRLKNGPNGYPVYYTGKEGTVAPHWSDLEDLGVYLDPVTDKGDA